MDCFYCDDVVVYFGGHFDLVGCWLDWMKWVAMGGVAVG